MTTRKLIAAALLTGAALIGGLGATAASDTGGERRAAAEAKGARKALDSHKAAKAVARAEAAVAFDPRNPAYRVLLGQAYLAAGRFPSAVGALGDALSLDPSSGPAALHLALAQIATGQWDAARETLNTHDAIIPAGDRGLAYALAGDPGTAVTILTAAARGPDSDAKTRQNLALSLALSGRWNEAKSVASLDMSPADVDQRIMQWAAFAKPTGAADQVAALLGVVPVEDAGQPQRLALAATAPHVVAAAQAVPAADGLSQVAAPDTADAATPAVNPGSADVANIGAAPVSDAAPAPAIVFADRQEIVQAIPAQGPYKVRTTTAAAVRPPLALARSSAPRAPAAGNFYVQLGAYDNAGVARDAWGRLSSRFPALGSHAPVGASVASGGRRFYRLSVGGFARGDADALCRKVRAGGGRCFVRAAAGDVGVAWVRAARGVQLAMR